MITKISTSADSDGYKITVTSKDIWVIEKIKSMVVKFSDAIQTKGEKIAKKGSYE